MSKKTDVWMPLYIGDYLADTGRLTTEQHGAYLLIIMDYWRNGSPPDDDEALAAITRLPLQAWQKHRKSIERMFTIIDGEWVHKRIEEELQASKDNKEKSSKRGKAGAEKRWSTQCLDDASSIAQASSTQCLDDAQAMLNPMLKNSPSPSPSPIKSNTPPYPPPGDDGFDAFWERYPKKVGKAAALKAWRKLKPDVGKQSVMLAALAVQVESESWRKDGGQFVPNPATWLNGARWEDEVQVNHVVAGRIGVNVEALRDLDYQQRMFDYDVSPQDKRRRRIDWIITLEGLYEPPGYDERRLQERRDIVLKNARLEPGQTMRELFKTAYGTDPQAEIEARLAHIRGASGVAA